MSKIYNKKIIKNSYFGLKILAVLAFVLIFVPFNKVVAQTAQPAQTQCGEAGCNYIFRSPVVVNPPDPSPVVMNPVVYNPTPTPTPTPTPVATVTPKKTTVAKAKTTQPAEIAYYLPVAAGTYGAITNLPDDAIIGDNTSQPESVGDLTASAVLGSANSFFPSGLIQWILFAIIILIIVILSRRAFGGKKKYQETPLKHA